jgi:PAS domain-containing protein
LERLAEGFVALDLRGRVTYLTDRAVRLLGRRRAELLGAEPWDVLPWLNYPVYENATHALDVGGDLYDLIDLARTPPRR